MVSCLSSVSLLVQILSSFLKTRTFLGCLLVFPQSQPLFLTYRPIAGAELNNEIPNCSSAGFSKDSSFNVNQTFSGSSGLLLVVSLRVEILLVLEKRS